MTFQVTKKASYIVLYCLLSFFTFLAFLSLPFISKKVPEFIRSRFLLYGVTKVQDENSRKDYFLSARKAAGAVAIGLSFFATSIGSWVFYGSSELGANPSISWIGVIGYALATATPAFLLMFLGPLIKRATEPEKVYCAADFAKLRFGRIMYVVVSGVSLFGMFIFLTSEMTAIAQIFSTMTSIPNLSYQISITISIGVFTIFYTTVAGYPASMISDRFESVMILIFILMLLIATVTVPENRVNSTQFAKASNWTLDGFIVAVTLNISVIAAGLFDQSNWQRVYAADSDKAIRRGYLWGAILCFLVMMYYGILGMIGYAKDPAAYDSYEKYAYLSFFYILEPLNNFWHIIILFLTCSLSTSTIDTLQNAITSVFSHDLMKLRVKYNPLMIARLLVVAINVPAVYIASKQFSILSLFLIGNLVSTTCAVPVFLGLQKKDALGGFLTAPTEFGAFSGCIAGVVTVIVNGYINGENKNNPFEYFWLRNGAVCAFCGTKTMWTFIITPAVGGFVTYLVSFLDVNIRGERAREPIIRIAFDKKVSATVADEESVSKDAVKTFDGANAVKVEEYANKNNENDAIVVHAEILQLPKHSSAST